MRRARRARDHPLRRRSRRRARPADAARAAAQAARALCAELRRGQRGERGRRARHHTAHRRGAARRRRGRHHAGQPRLPSPRDLRLPRRAGADPAARQLPALPTRARRLRRRAPRRAPRRGQPVGQPVPAGGPPGVRGDRVGPGEPRRAYRPRPRRHARGGHEREGGDGLVPRRSRDRRRGDAHPRPHCGRPGAAGRDRLHHRRGDDRPARRSDRRQEGAGDRVAADPHVRAVRDRR